MSISDVLFVPCLDQNLLSVAQMMKSHYSFEFKHDLCTVFDSFDCETAKAKMVDNSFPLNLKYGSSML